jgi:hypothetical protein
MRLCIISTTDGKFLETIVDTSGPDERPELQLDDYLFKTDTVIPRDPPLIELVNSNYRIVASRLE